MALAPLSRPGERATAPYARGMLWALCLVVSLAATGRASAFQCVYEPPPGRALATADEVVEFVVEGDERHGETACAVKARVVKAIKGSLKEGDGFRISYEPDGSCGGLYTSGSTVLEGLYGDRGGIYRLPFCGGSLSDAVVQAYLKQKRDFARSAAKQPQSFAALLGLAQFLVDWNDAPAAEHSIDAATALSPGNREIALLQARFKIRSGRGDTEQLVQAIHELQALAGTDSVALLLLAEARARQARSIELAGAKTQVKARPPQSVPGLSDLTAAEMTGESLSSVVLAGLSAPNSDWTASALAELDLSDAKVDGAIFTQALLDGTNFSRASLVKAKFAGASIARANFSHAQLQLANLSDVTAFDASFRGADLRGATVGGYLSGADFSGADLRGADLRRLRPYDGVWTGARIDCATRLHRSIDPAKVGMIVEGNCPDGAQAGK